MKVLVADDDPTSRLVLNSVLRKWGYEVLTAEDGGKAWEILSSADPPPLAVLDWMMPVLDGPEICRRVRARKGRARPYLILLTAKDSPEDVAAGLDAGADDYLGKPFAPEELRARLAVGKRFAALYEQLLATQSELERQARTDALTGVLNRRAIMEELAREIARATRDQTPLAVAMLDIDHFKHVNDSYGHAVGDQVLQLVVERVKSRIRSYDLLGRFGGEEFLLVLPGIGESEAYSVCERVRETIKCCPLKLPEGDLSVTVSLGVAEYRSQSLDTLLAEVDNALYEAKRRGRDLVVRASDLAL